MESTSTIKINFRGGIISPGDLYNILVAAKKSGIRFVSFGLRQQLLVRVSFENKKAFTTELDSLHVSYEDGKDIFPNIISSYAAEEIFITNSWLSEGVYKDIFDGMNYQPKLKINVSDRDQSFTPMLTGNINWVASTSHNFWHLFIRFPKTNIIYEWNQLVYTNDVQNISREIETIMLDNARLFIDNRDASGEELFSRLNKTGYILQKALSNAVLPPFKLPYYEGLNRYNSKYWLGVYRRDELFSIDFLKDLCSLCLDTKIGQLCSTPWKSIIVKSIEEKDRLKWNQLLDRYQVNMRHAANELNFQVEDNCLDGLQLKQYLVKQLNDEDIRTFGLCIGIKTRRKSEVFCNILVRRKPLVTLFGREFFHLYDILCAHNYNPNERTGFVQSRNNFRFLLGEQLRRAVIAYYDSSEQIIISREKAKPSRKEKIAEKKIAFVFQCTNCLTIYDSVIGEPDGGIQAGTAFEQLPDDYCCPLCEGNKSEFKKIEKTKLGLQAV